MLHETSRMIFANALVAGVLVCVSACGSGDKSRADARANAAAGGDLAARFVDDIDVQREVLSTELTEAARRLGSFELEASSSFVFSRSGEDVEQLDTYAVTRDANGGSHTVIETPESSLEVYRVEDEIYVRYDKGHLRHKPLREMDVESVAELAYSGLAQTLQIFELVLAFGVPEAAKVGDRKALRVPVLAARDARSALHIAPIVRPPFLPETPPGSWRSVARPLDVRGALWIDLATGVVTRAEIDGRVEIADRDVRPTQLTLRYHSQLSHIGAVPTITAPKARPEFRRQRPPSDQLSFFRHQLPAPAATKP